MTRLQGIQAIFLLVLFATSLSAQDVGSVLPFPPQSMDSVVKPSLQDSTMKWPAQPQRLPADAPSPSLFALPTLTTSSWKPVYNLTQEEAPVMVHYGTETIKYYLFVSLANPDVQQG
jgi:hypothetical protein